MERLDGLTAVLIAGATHLVGWLGESGRQVVARRVQRFVTGSCWLGPKGGGEQDLSMGLGCSAGKLEVVVVVTVVAGSSAGVVRGFRLRSGGFE